MNDFGVTPSGFVVKPIAAILQEKRDLARALFGSDVDLRSTSALQKILDVVSAEDQELWKALEANYYANFISTANGDALDLLGQDLGLERGTLHARGSVTVTLSGAAPDRTYVIPVGAIVETAAAIRFRTEDSATLSGTRNRATVGVRAVLPGASGNVAKNAVVALNAAYAQQSLTLGSATIAVENALAFTGGADPIDDETYRTQLLRLPRTLFTTQSVKAAVLNLDGVRDCRISDPLGGVDVSRSIFGGFVFDRRRFGQARFLGSPYYFDVFVAPLPGFAWAPIGGVPGLRETVAAAVDTGRPVGIFPNIRLADSVSVGVRADVLTRPGMDAAAVDAALRAAFERRVSVLGLGRNVLASEVLRDFMNVAGVVDVQNLHLRRDPPAFGSIVFGDRESFQGSVIEAPLGANLALSQNEIATFRYESRLVALAVSDR